MGEGPDEAACGLTPQDRLAVRGAPGGRRGDRPGQRNRRPQQQRRGQSAVPRRPAHGTRVARPPGRQERRRQGVDQDHRPLCQDAEPDRQPEQRPASRRASAPGHDDAQESEQGEKRDQGVEHGQGGENRPQQAAQQDQGRQGGDIRTSRPKAPGQGRGGEEARQAEQRGHQSGPPVVDAEGPPSELDQPEQQRGLVAVGLAVELRHQDFALDPHLPGDA